MIDTCVCCGDVVPEGRQVCVRCENGRSNNGVICPECGSLLEVMDLSWWNTCDGICKSTLFHCNVCHSDWEKEAKYIAQPVEFKRKFWG